MCDLTFLTISHNDVYFTLKLIRAPTMSKLPHYFFLIDLSHQLISCISEQFIDVHEPCIRKTNQSFTFEFIHNPFIKCRI